MLKYFSKILILLLVSFYVTNAQLQLLVPVTYDANIKLAKDEVIKAGMTNPKLIAVATVQQTLDFGGMKLDMSLDLNTGKSPFWLYVFSEPIEQDSFLLGGIAVLQLMTGPQIVPFDDELSDSGLGLTLNTDLTEIKANDAIDALKSIKDNQTFSEFYSQNQPLDYFSAVLFVNESNKILEANASYWMFTMTKGELNKMCFLEIGTKETICITDIVSVNDKESKMESNVYPNPSTDIIEVDNFAINGDFGIYDVYGRKVIDYTYTLKQNGITLNISKLSSGLYYLRTKDNYLMFIKQ
jgi:hypothetical protein